mmetsp:Transcript_105218/g.314270  ORF Transcript_105218/g.314270 Transcript_105218/m.314270 type:complete len:219 (+) Transcript_105218:24-680(+)
MHDRSSQEIEPTFCDDSLATLARAIPPFRSAPPTVPQADRVSSRSLATRSWRLLLGRSSRLTACSTSWGVLKSHSPKNPGCGTSIASMAAGSFSHSLKMPSRCSSASGPSVPFWNSCSANSRMGLARKRQRSWRPSSCSSSRLRASAPSCRGFRSSRLSALSSCSLYSFSTLSIRALNINKQVHSCSSFRRSLGAFVRAVSRISPWLLMLARTSSTSF